MTATLWDAVHKHKDISGPLLGKFYFAHMAFIGSCLVVGFSLSSRLDIVYQLLLEKLLFNYSFKQRTHILIQTKNCCKYFKNVEHMVMASSCLGTK